MANKLTGKRYLMDVGVLKTELHFESESSMVFTVLEGGGLTEKGHSERVAITLAEIRPDVYMIAWKEASGATVTHVEDHQNGVIYSNATLPDGSFYTMRGTVKPL
ncbi:MoaF-related domain-containing protein [Flavobacterium beibuense]|uniref:Metallo-beta-lactamase family protein n=1 Tax=Flavobacterium beibuense TaxID=657326 RepID=A0A444WAE1_9FLAO|nr:Metallo-beta-lactamase family protein [Flavobacterium beibuense]